MHQERKKVNSIQTRKPTGSSLRPQIRHVSKSAHGITRTETPMDTPFDPHLTFSTWLTAHVRTWRVYPQSAVVTFEIQGSRYCHNIGREHRSNNGKSPAPSQRPCFITGQSHHIRLGTYHAATNLTTCFLCSLLRHQPGKRERHDHTKVPRLALLPRQVYTLFSELSAVLPYSDSIRASHF